MSERISGILTPNITPVDSKGRIDEDTLRGYVDWLIDHGVDGLYPNGSTGEFIRFNPDERRQIVRIVVEQTAGRVPVLAGAAEANADETIRACNTYGEMGVRAVAIVAPFYYRLSSEAVYAYFQHIAKHVEVDVTLYNIPMFASPIDVDTVVRLASEEPRIIGIKDSSGDLPNLMRMMAAIRPMRDDFSFLTGWDPSLTAMLISGADGGTNATSGVVPELTRAIHRSVLDGNIEKAVSLQYELIPLFDMMIGLGEFPDGFRAGARARGWDLGLGRVPVTDQQRETVKIGEQLIADAVQSKVVANGVTPSIEAIQQIVQRVMQAL